MNYFTRTLLVVVLVTGMIGCALPRPETGLQSFVPEPELAAVSLLREGQSHFAAGRAIDAELKIRQALYLFPQADNIKISLASTLERGGLFDDAKAIYGELLARKPDSYKLNAGLAHVYYLESRFDESVKLYEKAFVAAADKGDIPAAADFSRSLAVAYLAAGKEDPAQCWSSLAYTLGHDPVEAVRHAKILVARGYYTAAKDTLTDFISAQNANKDPNLQHELAITVFGLGDFAQAVSLEELVLTTTTIDPAIQFEANLVRQIAGKHLPAADTSASSLSADELEERAEKEHEEALASAQSAMSSKAPLYWPVNLIEEVKALADEADAKEAE